jgi:hypothetical protein
MAHAFHHAKSSARRFGGKPGDYLKYHQFMDHTKLHFADARHRLVLHNSWGMGIAEQVFGTTIVRPSDGKEIPLRTVLEQHILEDLGRIPTLEQCLSQVTLEPWMYRNAEALSRKEDEENDANTDGTATTANMAAPATPGIR